MQPSESRPNPQKLSTLTATVLLVYALTQFIRVPLVVIPLQLPGLFIPINVQFSNLIWLGVAIIAITGMEWLMADRSGGTLAERIQHALLPAITAWVIGIPLYSLDPGPIWWVIYILGGLLLVAVFVAEYYSVDLNSSFSTPAVIGLSAVSYTLFLILSASVRFSGARLYLLVPAIFAGTYIIATRILLLMSKGTWQNGWAVAIGVVVSQVAVGFYYLPLSPLQFGLISTGLLYASIVIADRSIKNSIQKMDLVEAVAALILTSLLALVTG